MNRRELLRAAVAGAAGLAGLALGFPWPRKRHRLSVEEIACAYPRSVLSLRLQRRVYNGGMTVNEIRSCERRKLRAMAR